MMIITTPPSISVHTMRAAGLAVLLFGAAAIAACRADSLVSLGPAQRNQRVSVRVGERIEVVLQTIGSGEYAEPPAISSPAVTFLDVASCGDPVPAGPRQCFHFRAVAPGRAVLTFTHTGNNPPVVDTVDVRS